MTQPAARSLTADLTDQVALVTGASRGLGRAIALELACNGARVACVARDRGALAETVEAIHAVGGRAAAHACDVKDRNSVEQVVDQVLAQWDRLDILVNNAGINRDTLLPGMRDEDWEEVLTTNLTGTFLFCRAVSRQMMRARYGRIVNIASVSGMIGTAGQTNYAASKAGQIGFARSLSQELAGRKVTVNAVAPGYIESEMTEAMGELVLGEVKKRIPAKRLGTAEEVAAAVLYLVSPAAAYVTGQVLVIDGGMTG